MKVRLLNLAAAAAIATGAQGVAQEQGDSLARALADLNRGVVVPQAAASTVTANASTAANIGGDARVRNTWANPAGGPNDIKNVDARVHLNVAFDVHPDASAFVQFNANENWGTFLGPNVATGEPTNLNTGSVNQAWFTGRNIILDGEEWKFGRSAYQLGSGRILGTDDWNQLLATFSGVWYTNPLEGWNLNLFMITDVFNAGGLNGAFFPPGDRDLFGAQVDYKTDAIPFLETVSFRPYVLRLTQQGAPTGTTNWYGAEANGEISAFDWDVEGVWVASDANRAPEPSSFNAWAVDVDVELGEWVSELPGGIKPVLQLGAAQADSTGVAINPVYHDVAGIADVQARFGRPGVWSGAADSWQGAISLEPQEGWVGKVAYIHFNDNDPTDAAALDANEIDVTVSHTFHNRVSLWLGWARVDFNATDANAYIVYGTLSLPF